MKHKSILAAGALSIVLGVTGCATNRPTTAANRGVHTDNHTITRSAAAHRNQATVNQPASIGSANTDPLSNQFPAANRTGTVNAGNRFNNTRTGYRTWNNDGYRAYDRNIERSPYGFNGLFSPANTRAFRGTTGGYHVNPYTGTTVRGTRNAAVTPENRDSIASARTRSMGTTHASPATYNTNATRSSNLNTVNRVVRPRPSSVVNRGTNAVTSAVQGRVATAVNRGTAAASRLNSGTTVTQTGGAAKTRAAGNSTIANTRASANEQTAATFSVTRSSANAGTRAKIPVNKGGYDLGDGYRSSKTRNGAWVSGVHAAGSNASGTRATTRVNRNTGASNNIPVNQGGYRLGDGYRSTKTRSGAWVSGVNTPYKEGTRTRSTTRRLARVSKIANNGTGTKVPVNKGGYSLGDGYRSSKTRDGAWVSGVRTNSSGDSVYRRSTRSTTGTRTSANTGTTRSSRTNTRSNTHRAASNTGTNNTLRPSFYSDINAPANLTFDPVFMNGMYYYPRPMRHEFQQVTNTETRSNSSRTRNRPRTVVSNSDTVTIPNTTRSASRNTTVTNTNAAGHSDKNSLL